MKHELTTQTFSTLLTLLDTCAHPVVNAIVEGNSPGRIFVDARDNPQSAFILTNCGYSYLAGKADNAAFNASLSTLLAESLLSEIAHSEDPTLILYPLSPGWDDKISVLIKNHTPIKLYRRTFTFDPAKFAALIEHCTPPKGFELCALTQSLLNKNTGDAFTWISPAYFLEHGIGFYLLDGDTVASKCHSVFIGAGMIEIGVNTAEAYRRRGLATITASALIEHGLERGVTPNWECWWDNEASAALAQKLGFEHKEDHPVYYLELK